MNPVPAPYQCVTQSPSSSVWYPRVPRTTVTIAGPGCVCQPRALFGASRRCQTKTSAWWFLTARASGAISKFDTSLCVARKPTGTVPGSTWATCEATATLTLTATTSAATPGRIHFSRTAFPFLRVAERVAGRTDLLFAAGIVWRAANPNTSEAPVDEPSYVAPSRPEQARYAPGRNRTYDL